MSRVERSAIRRIAGLDSNLHRGLTVSRVTMAFLTVAFGTAALIDLRVPLQAQAAVYLIGMVALNLPHGGYEHFENLRRRARDVQWRYIGAYLLLVAGFLGLFFFAPVFGLALAIAVACLKGGIGGVHVLDATTGTTHLQTRPQRLLAAAVRGGAVMMVPIFAHPGTFQTFSGLMVGIFDPGAMAPLARHFGVTRVLIGGAFVVMATAHIALGAVRGGDTSWRLDVVETGLLTAYFAVVPVVIAVGLYFPFWYSARQVARSAAVDRPSTAGRDLLAASEPTGVALKAWGMLVAGALATGAVVGAIWYLAPNPLGTGTLLTGLVAFWSVSISIIALPHVVVGSLLDRDQGIWYVP
ncbi:MAG: Brp/Blh family beta-carotene 15,15'-dioxygenase [Halodesulfurarchaeum sp.]